mgnify:CR=1 FL=1
MNFGEWLSQPWPWYIAGPLIGLTVPLLLLAGNKSFGVSSSLRHICAACIPAGIPYFRYDWRKEAWNLFFVAGMIIGAFIAAYWLSNGQPVVVDERLSKELQSYNIQNFSKPAPVELFNWSNLLTLKGFIVMIAGGFLVGFGTRYAGGCTSGHSIMGISNLQWPSMAATVCFMVGGFITANLLLPVLLKL